MKELNLESEDFHSCKSSETSELEHVCSKNLNNFMHLSSLHQRLLRVCQQMKVYN